MPKSVPTMKCNFCDNPLRQHEVFACYSCLSEHCPQLREVIDRQKALMDKELSTGFWKPVDVPKCSPQDLPSSCASFHSLHYKCVSQRHAWNVWFCNRFVNHGSKVLKIWIVQLNRLTDHAEVWSFVDLQFLYHTSSPTWNFYVLLLFTWALSPTPWYSC